MSAPSPSQEFDLSGGVTAVNHAEVRTDAFDRERAGRLETLNYSLYGIAGANEVLSHVINQSIVARCAILNSVIT